MRKLLSPRSSCTTPARDTVEPKQTAADANAPDATPPAEREVKKLFVPRLPLPSTGYLARQKAKPTDAISPRSPRSPRSRSFIEKFEETNRAIDEWSSKKIDGITNKMLDDMLLKTGRSMEKIASNSFYGGPQWLIDAATKYIRFVWSVTSPVLREQMVGPNSGDYTRLLVLSWSTEHPLFWPEGASYPHGWTWLRARYLYAMYPGDKSIFQKLQNPVYFLIMMLKLSSYTAVPTFVLQFLFIDKSDEYQVCNFILSFKAYQFMTALSVAVSLSFSLYDCLGAESYILGAPRACDALMPSAADSYDVVMLLEIPRLVTLVCATLLLRSGKTFGGPGELRALAEVRIDAADGELDGFADTAAVEMNLQESSVADSKSVRSTDAALWEEHIQAARKKFKATEGRGNYLQSWMVFDFGVLTSLTAVMFINFVLLDVGMDMVVFRNTLYYIKLAWALASCPFLIFLFPVIGPALATPYITAYSTLGALVPKLSSSAIVKKDALAKYRELDRKKLKNSPKFVQWWHDSTARRVTKAVLDAANPLDNQVKGFESLV